MFTEAGAAHRLAPASLHYRCVADLSDDRHGFWRVPTSATIAAIAAIAIAALAGTRWALYTKVECSEHPGFKKSRPWDGVPARVPARVPASRPGVLKRGGGVLKGPPDEAPISLAGVPEGWAKMPRVCLSPLPGQRLAGDHLLVEAVRRMGGAAATAPGLAGAAPPAGLSKPGAARSSGSAAIAGVEITGSTGVRLSAAS